MIDFDDLNLKMTLILTIMIFLAHLSRWLIGELIVYRSNQRLCVRASVHLSVRSHFQT